MIKRIFTIWHYNAIMADDVRKETIQEIARQMNAHAGLSIVGVTGFDASGKTSITEEIAQVLESANGRAVVRISIDDFYNPRARWQDKTDPARKWYQHGYDYKSFLDDVIAPLKAAQAAGVDAHVPLKVFDRINDVAVARTETHVPKEALVIVEGIFLARPGLADVFDHTLFVYAPIKTLLERSVARDTGRLGTSQDVFNVLRDTYLGAHRFYMDQSAPHVTADTVIDNTDFTRPVFVDAGGRSRIGADLKKDLAALPSWTYAAADTPKRPAVKPKTAGMP